jgi:hypothetical protein
VKEFLDLKDTKCKETHRKLGLFPADLNIFSTAHTGFADLDTANKNGTASLNPPKNGAGEFSIPFTFPRKNWVPEWCRLKKIM